jgi:hypothetical protein
VYWIHLAKDRDSSSALLKKLRNLYSHKYWEFLD